MWASWFPAAGNEDAQNRGWEPTHPVRGRGSPAGGIGQNEAVTCESCGAAEDVLYAVRRRYVTPAAWDTPARDVVLDDVEQWCFSCCTHYPHVPVED
jgi:hypothetical protein